MPDVLADIVVSMVFLSQVLTKNLFQSLMVFCAKIIYLRIAIQIHINP
jgi:hypothetical protein